ncbi:hypothetical protein NDU88_006831 [Pleurodeles waltl]|uniref:Uncharacterized protein n=1 Tax=Pleurodeles waltl TaxID=8319 RepID=A0AAV7PJI9_PLEWA|nr:hypothetical protein NDU88_006831 [Pleurodeles waltl]
MALIDVQVPAYTHEVLKREWRDHDKIMLLRFMAKSYPFQDMQKDLLDYMPIDHFVANLLGRISLVEDAIIKAAIRAGICGTYVASSLITNIKSLCRSLKYSSGFSDVLEHTEKQVEYLSDISFDLVQASVLSGGACVADHRNLALKGQRTDSEHKYSASWLPFQWNSLFGPELEAKLYKTA